MELISHIDIASDKHILDIGCGDGKITAHLAAVVPQGRVMGVDLSSEMIDIARRKSVGLGNIRWVEGDKEEFEPMESLRK